MPIDISTSLKYYKRSEVQEAIVKSAEGKEIGVLFQGNFFGKRPDILKYPKDILELAKNGATSFHCSEETWSNPLQLNSNLKRNELDELRSGWDLIIDIDSKILDYSKIAADLVVQALRYYDIDCLSTKFSVSGDTPVLIKVGGKIRLVSIKKAINVFRAGKKVKVFSSDKNLKLGFFEIYDFLSHKDNTCKLYYRQSGVPLVVTGHHSVFVWENCNVVQKKVIDIKKGDFLVSYNSFNELEIGKNSILNEFEYKNEKIKKKLKITKELCRLIGYYLSEGHIADVNSMVGFSFDFREREYIEDCKKLSKNVSGKSTISEHKPHPTSAQVVFYSKEWYSFFKNECGKGSKNKHLPDFVWRLPKNYFLEILKGYLRGDAHKKSLKYLTVKSVSKQLSTEFLWLCKMHGISVNLYSEKNKPHLLNGKMFKGSFVFMLKIPRKDIPIKEFNLKRNKFSRLSADKVYPTTDLFNVYKQIKPGSFNKHRVEQMTLKKKMASKSRLLKVIKWMESCGTVEASIESKRILSSYKSLIRTELSLLPVTKFNENKSEMVYDVSVKESERFFGGYYPILLHNSGNHGFHLAIPFEAFPETVNEQKVKNLFPEGPRRIASHLKRMILPFLTKTLLDKESIDEIMKKTGLKKEEITVNGKFDPFSFVGIDTILISSRHLFRMPYSLNEKSGLVSIPIKPERILEFNKDEEADPKNILFERNFMNRELARPGEARKLFIQAFDETVEVEPIVKNEIKEFVSSATAVPEQYFPPCIKLILQGLKDGKKRSVFTLTNFLTCNGWGYDDIQKLMTGWNKKNPEPLREVIIQGHLKYHKKQSKKILPPNCSNKAYYSDLGICQPDSFCQKITNPANYSILKQKIVSENKPVRKKKVEQKESIENKN